MVNQSSHICTSVVRECLIAFLQAANSGNTSFVGQLLGCSFLWCAQSTCSSGSAQHPLCLCAQPLQHPGEPNPVEAHTATLAWLQHFLWKVFVKLWQHVKDKRGRNRFYLPSACLCCLRPQEQLPSLLNSPNLPHIHPQKSLAHPDLECQDQSCPSCTMRSQH